MMDELTLQFLKETIPDKTPIIFTTYLDKNELQDIIIDVNTAQVVPDRFSKLNRNIRFNCLAKNVKNGIKVFRECKMVLIAPKISFVNSIFAINGISLLDYVDKLLRVKFKLKTKRMFTLVYCAVCDLDGVELEKIK